MMLIKNQGRHSLTPQEESRPEIRNSKDKMGNREVASKIFWNYSEGANMMGLSGKEYNHDRFKISP
jgi:hypothetical protein